MVFQDRVAMLHGGGKHEDVALLKSLRLDVRGQAAIQHCRVQILFAAHGGEGLTAFQHVDRLPIADDQELVDRNLLGRRIPGKREIAGRKALPILDLQRALHIRRGDSRFEADLLVAQ
ncbi:hypothetical protein H9L15_10120 [Sphingomonas daechungensis]|uniref:Uncharacterized protein n=1 Tax=Sphingomonas daechungensis TaxID=1176646 RepID=A0ABX6T4R7_9SPHN|nr:hypothetical protein [Sphingomonas daechungensis]QNP44529.1 hypothetical protein H9L15_10120 [Sphingomonas daechungensis]